MFLFISIFAVIFIEFINCANIPKNDDSLSLINDYIDSRAVTDSQISSKYENNRKKKKHDRLNKKVTSINKKGRVENITLETKDEVNNEPFPINISPNDRSENEYDIYQTEPLDLRIKRDLIISSDQIVSIHNKSCDYSLVDRINQETERTGVGDNEKYYGDEDLLDSVPDLNHSDLEKMISNNSTIDEQEIVDFDFEKYILNNLDKFNELEIPVNIYRNNDEKIQMKNRIKNFIDNVKAFKDNIDSKPPSDTHMDLTDQILTIDNLFLQLEEKKAFIKNGFSLYNSNDIEKMFLFALKLVEIEKNINQTFPNYPFHSFYEKDEFLGVLDKFKNLRTVYFLHEITAIKKIYDTGFTENIREGYILYTCFLFGLFFTQMEIILSNIEQYKFKIKNNSCFFHNIPYKKRLSILNLDIATLFLKTIFMRILYGCKDGQNIGKIYLFILLLDFRCIIFDFDDKIVDNFIGKSIKINIFYTNAICLIKSCEFEKSFTEKMSSVLRIRNQASNDFFNLNDFSINETSVAISFYIELIADLEEKCKEKKWHPNSLELIKEQYKTFSMIFNSNNKEIGNQIIILKFLIFYYSYMRKFLYSKYQFEIFLSNDAWRNQTKRIVDSLFKSGIKKAGF